MRSTHQDDERALTITKTATNTLYDALEYGPIVAGDSEVDCFVTVNGAYLNFWAGDGQGGYANTDCRAMPKDLYKTTGAEMLDLAQEYLKDALREDDEDDA